MKRFKPNGKRIRELRENLERNATQKEIATAAEISEHQFQLIETRDKEVPADVLGRIAAALRVNLEDIVYATDGPRLVPPEGAEPLVPRAMKDIPDVVEVPRFDTDIATVARDEVALLNESKNCHVVVPHVLTKLTGETETYVEEMTGLLESVTWEKRDIRVPIDGREELRLRRRLRELLVLLKGNDVWVYVTTNMKFLPESDAVQKERNVSGCRNQLIVAFGPPGEYGEESVKVPVDHGQPWVYNPKVLPF